MSVHFEAGKDAGRSAGSWFIDGNTTSETAQAIIQGHDDGDPEIMDMQPSPLSGEWAGESVAELIPGWNEMSDAQQDEATSDYEAGFQEGFWDEVLRSAKNLVS